ncbi:4754_t:CDS:2 [Entrophospora sp. SA101]|nr:4754_t:CDS:2 [Entrophospora sp. SA101]
MKVDPEIDEVQLLIDQINVNNDDNIITARSYIDIDSDLGTEILDDDEIIATICSNNYESNSASSPPWSSYDPYVPKEGAAGGPPSKTVEIQKKIDDTVEAIRDNLKFVAGRGEKLDNLQDKTGNLCWKVKILLNNLAMSSH